MRSKSTNNKGYSLVELVITIAIFSIIMVAIIMMMRSTLASYRDGLFETSLQEEAQMVANQVADILIDANSLSGSGGSYIVGTPEGTVTLEQSGKKLTYNGHTLSDQMKEGSFTISGLIQRNEDDMKSTFDNAVVVTVSLESNGNSYTASKEVYFRNKIEDIAYKDGKKVNTPFDVAGGSTISSGGSSGDEDTCEVLRFQPVDISAKYDIVYDAKLSEGSNGAKGYFQDIDSTSSANTMITHPISGKTPKHYVLKLASAYESASGFDANFSGDTYYVEGLNSKGESVKVLLSLDAVALDNGAGIFYMKYNTDEFGSNGYPTAINAKGISINDALDSSNLGSITYTAVVKSNGTQKFKYENKNVLRTTDPYVKGITNKGDSPDTGDLKLVIAGDPLQAGMEMSTTKANRIDYLEDNSKKNTIDVEFNIAGRKYTVKYFMSYSGGTLEYFN